MQTTPCRDDVTGIVASGPKITQMSDLPEIGSWTPHEDLLEAARRGDAAALRELLVRHTHVLRTYVRLHGNAALRARESSSDIVQSVCRECLEDLGAFSFRGEPEFRKWLFQKAMAKLVDRHRYWNAQRRDRTREQGMPAEDLRASFLTVSQAAIRTEDLAALERCFDELPADYREVLVAAKLVGQTYAEIAADTGRTEGAVRMLLHRAMARLARLMDDRSAAG